MTPLPAILYTFQARYGQRGYDSNAWYPLSDGGHMLPSPQDARNAAAYLLTCCKETDPLEVRVFRLDVDGEKHHEVTGTICSIAFDNSGLDLTDDLPEAIRAHLYPRAAA